MIWMELLDRLRHVRKTRWSMLLTEAGQLTRDIHSIDMEEGREKQIMKF